MNSGKKVIAFIRHGEYEQLANTPSAFQPFGLTLQGAKQSIEAGCLIQQFVKTHQLKLHSAIHCSNLLRAWQTAELITDQLDTPCHIISSGQLNERSVGAVANLTVEQIEQVLEQDPRYQKLDFNWKSDSHYCLPFDGAESLIQAGKRVAEYLKALVTEPTEQDTLILVVGHGASFRHAAYLMGILSFEEIAKYSMHYATPIYFQYHEKHQAWSKIAGDWKQRSHKNNENLD